MRNLTEWNPLKPQHQHACSSHYSISNGPSWENLLKHQDILSVISFFILMTRMFDQVVIL